VSIIGDRDGRRRRWNGLLQCPGARTARCPVSGFRYLDATNSVRINVLYGVGSSSGLSTQTAADHLFQDQTSDEDAEELDKFGMRRAAFSWGLTKSKGASANEQLADGRLDLQARRTELAFDLRW
jgi:hypothetical protein